MLRRFICTALMSFGLGVWFFSSSSGLSPLQADEPPPPLPDISSQPATIEAQPLADQAAALKAQGIEALDNGPVHEAFAQPTPKNPEPGPIIHKQPPKAIEELPPEQKPEGDNVQWIKGYWAWDDPRNDFIWVSGFWRVPPPDRHWVPGYWAQAEDGWQWIPGYWASTEQNVQSNLPAPPESLDYGPTTPAPSEDAFYVPGNWVYTNHYLWQPGYWSFYRPGYIWNPACYYWTPDGYTFVNGYWDFPWWNRGLLFAPVCFHRPIFWNTGFFFRPFFAVTTPFLSTFFFHPHHHDFFFGHGDHFHHSGFQAASFNRVNNSVHVTNVNNVTNINNVAGVRSRNTGGSVLAPATRVAANTHLGAGVTTRGGMTRLNAASGHLNAAAVGSVRHSSAFAESRGTVNSAAHVAASPRVTGSGVNPRVNGSTVSPRMTGPSVNPRVTGPATSSRVTGPSRFTAPSRGSTNFVAPSHAATHGSQSHAIRTAPTSHVSHYSAPAAPHMSGPAFHNPAPAHFSSGGHPAAASHSSAPHVSGTSHSSGGGHGGGGHPAPAARPAGGGHGHK